MSTIANYPEVSNSLSGWSRNTVRPTADKVHAKHVLNLITAARATIDLAAESGAHSTVIDVSEYDNLVIDQSMAILIDLGFIVKRRTQIHLDVSW